LYDKDRYNKTTSKIRFGFDAENISSILVNKTDEIPLKVIKMNSKKNVIPSNLTFY
jgi:hypothetical protein